ncbi:MAG TPA: hypothetical protein DDZ80_04405, partial [Cyanobacteria bacterium UBA8803]|nr:hypothetical protein [Cyanobacteria bacterium UBA8803]
MSDSLSDSLSDDDIATKTELRLSGLVVKQNGGLRVYNPIYAAIFNLSWVEDSLRNLRPYAVALDAWVQSNYQDESRLLRGEALQEALAWKAGRSLSLEDDRFLDTSRELDQREIKRELVVKEEESRILAEAKRKADKRIKIGAVVLVLSFIVAGLALVVAGDASQKARTAQAAKEQVDEEVKNAQVNLQSASAKALFLEGKKFDSLLAGLRAGKQLKQLQKPTANTQMEVVTALHQAVFGVREFNRLEGHQDFVYSVSFSPDGQTIAS